MSHIDLGRRAALVVRIAAAIELQARPLPHADEYAVRSNENLLKDVLARADEAEFDTERLDEKLHDIAKAIEERSIRGDGRGLQELRRRVDAFVARLRAFQCVDCAKRAEKVCHREVTDEAVVTEVGLCLKQLKDLLAFVHANTRNLYQTWNTSFIAPGVAFSTSYAQARADRPLLKEFGLNGSSDVRGVVPIINLEIKDGHFHWETLCQVLYVLTHELVCHAFQGGAAANRRNGDEKCSWSEGWMDRLAYGLVHHWTCNDETALPEHFERERRAVEAHYTKYHDRRYQPMGTLLDVHQNRRETARRAFDECRGAWSFDVELPSHRVTQFSTKLNLCTMDFDQREGIINWLFSNVQEPGTERYEQTLQACSEFLDHGEASTLLDELEKIGTRDP